MVAKSFPLNRYQEKKKLKKLLTNNFLAEHFYGSKIISSKTGLKEKIEQNILIKQFFGGKFFMVAKSFPRKQV